MRWSQCFIPTLRQEPAGVETAAERLLIRAGLIRAVSTGVYGYLPLGMRSLGKIQRIAREELIAIGGQEVLLTETAAAAIAAGELRSARQLPQIWFRITTDLLRMRQFAGLDVSWFGADRALIEEALQRTARRCGVEGRWPVLLSDVGPDTAAVCTGCAYAAGLPLADGVPVAPLPDIEGDLAPEEFHTPGQKTIADLSRFTGQPESMQMKSLVLVANGKPILVMLRGDHQLSEAKFAAKSGDPNVRQAAAGEIVKWFGASAGSLGPVGVKSIPVWMDSALSGRRNMVCGANRDDYHLRHVTPGEDFEAEVADMRQVASGDRCRYCGAMLELRPAVELARVREDIAQLSLDRLLTAAVEAGNDKDGIVFPASVAPFQVVVTAVGASEPAESLYREFRALDIDTVLDDRDERAGVKFKDADLIGVPWRVTVGKKIAEGLIELVERRTKSLAEVPLAEIAKRLKGLLSTNQGG